MKNVKTKIAAITFIGLALFSGKVFSETKVTLWGHNVTLPFPKEWLAKGSEKKNSFVFFNAKAAPPRLMISLYASSFKYPRKDLSEFEKILKERKTEWLKKVEAKALAAPQIIKMKESNSILLKLSFETSQGKFEEWTHFEECHDQKGIVLKAMIPTTQRDSFKEYEKVFETPLCQRK